MRDALYLDARTLCLAIWHLVPSTVLATVLNTAAVVGGAGWGREKGGRGARERGGGGRGGGEG